MYDLTDCYNGHNLRQFLKVRHLPIQAKHSWPAFWP